MKGIEESVADMEAAHAAGVARLDVSPEAVVGGLSGDQFKFAFRNHAAGVAVVTADDGDGPVAMTATSVFSISAEPPLFVFSASEFSSSTPTLKRAETVVVHLLGTEDLVLAQRCATSGIDRFAETAAWTRLPTGEPVFVAVPMWIRGRVIARLDTGTATLFVIHALEAKTPPAPDHGGEAWQPLVYHNRMWHELGEGSFLA